MQDGFLEKWENQRKAGRVVYAIKHAILSAGIVALIAFFFHILGRDRPASLTLRTVMLFAVGGFGYGLIRFSLRERFYTAMKGQIDD